MIGPVEMTQVWGRVSFLREKGRCEPKLPFHRKRDFLKKMGLHVAKLIEK